MQNTASPAADRAAGLSSDPESDLFLARLEESERIRANRIPGVRSVLVVLSAAGMVYDKESLRQKVLLTYPDATVYFITTLGRAVGPEAPASVDLLIDFTGQRQRQAGIFFPRKLRARARMCVGRNAGILREHVYDRVFDETELRRSGTLDVLDLERQVQRQVLALAGVALAPQGDALPDRGQTIALRLPPIAKL